MVVGAISEFTRQWILATRIFVDRRGFHRNVSVHRVGKYGPLDETYNDTYSLLLQTTVYSNAFTLRNMKMNEGLFLYLAAKRRGEDC